MRVKRLLVIVAAMATSALVVGAGAGAGSADSVPGCGNGFTLVYNPAGEALISAQTHGNVNGDGYVCVNRTPNTAGGRGFVILVDNDVPA